jgi:hypothetical protein
MARIFWSKEEKAMVAERAFEIRKSVTTESDLECVKRAMREQVSAERQRNLISMSEIPWVQDTWRELTKNAQKAQIKTEQPKTANGRVGVDAPPPKVRANQPVIRTEVELATTPAPT